MWCEDVGLEGFEDGLDVQKCVDVFWGDGNRIVVCIVDVFLVGEYVVGDRFGYYQCLFFFVGCIRQCFYCWVVVGGNYDCGGDGQDLQMQVRVEIELFWCGGQIEMEYGQ